MMNVLKQNKLSSIGLDIDAHEIRAVQLMKTGNSDTVVAWAIFPRMNQSSDAVLSSKADVDELRWVSSILARRGFVGQNVTVSPPTSVCSSHVVELPPVESGAPIEQLARIEVARERKCSPDQIELGFWELPPKGKIQESLAVACPKSEIESTLDLYQDAGLVVAGMDLMELAISRGGEARVQTGEPRVEQEINTSLRIGWTSSLAILTLGDKVIYVRRIEHGAENVWDVATKRFQLSQQGAELILNGGIDEEDSESKSMVNHAAWSGLAKTITDELDIAIAYISHTFRMAPFGTIELSGYGATNPCIKQALDQVLGIPVLTAGPAALLGKIQPSDHAWGISSRLSTAYGLAARFDQ
ncbi:MAG: pilus assembly protein PilM [Phycisphaerales bacterium]|nr:pilus assembly protein PilM [Phycisphaerales bacterium]